MRVEKTFWFRDRNGVKQAFSYQKDDMAYQFAKKWGGEVINFIDLPEDMSAAVGTDELCSVIAKDTFVKEPESLAEDDRRYAVLVSKGEGFEQYGERFKFIKEANDTAKNVSKYYKTVLVVKRLNREMPSDMGVSLI